MKISLVKIHFISRDKIGMLNQKRSSLTIGVTLLKVTVMMNLMSFNINTISITQKGKKFSLNDSMKFLYLTESISCTSYARIS